MPIYENVELTYWLIMPINLIWTYYQFQTFFLIRTDYRFRFTNINIYLIQNDNYEIVELTYCLIMPIYLIQTDYQFQTNFLIRTDYRIRFTNINIYLIPNDNLWKCMHTHVHYNTSTRNHAYLSTYIHACIFLAWNCYDLQPRLFWPHPRVRLYKKRKNDIRQKSAGF